MLRQLAKPPVIHRPGARDHHLRRQVMRIDILPQIRPTQRAYIPLGTQYRPPQSGILECRPVEVIEDQLLVGLIHLSHLAEYHVPFPIHRARIQFGRQQYIGQYVHGARHVLLEHLGEVHGLLPAGVRVQVSAHVFDFDFQLVLGAFGRSLEGHVFEEVCRAVVVGRFVAGAGVDPHAYRGGGGGGDGFGCDAQAGGEGGYFRRGRC
mmetsp:Transcript_7353/g.16032  ORF Transcript_7353/g.16032 Transcript_7353/m.16032 type:complete len:207 (+) Transcript_7353:702-1322(+)